MAKKNHSPKREEKSVKTPSISEQVRHDREKESLRAKLELLNRKYKELIKSKRTQDQILEFNRIVVEALPTVKAPKPIKNPSKIQF